MLLHGAPFLCDNEGISPILGLEWLLNKESIMFRIAMVSIIVTLGLAGCGEDVTQKPMGEEKVSVEGITPSVVKNKVNTQDVKKNDVQAVAIDAQAIASSQAIAESLADTKEPIERKVSGVVKKESKPAIKPVEKKVSPVIAEAKGMKESPIVEEKESPNVASEPVLIMPSEQTVAKLGDAAQGKVLAKRCAACHDFGMKDKVGPHLQGVFNRAAGQSGFNKHSAALKAANWAWDEAHLLKWVCDSKSAIKEFTGDTSAKTKMPKQKMCGAKGNDVVAYLRSL